MSLSYFTKEFLALPEERQYEFLIDMAIPWYLQFYASWQHTSLKGNSTPLFLTYEELVETPLETLEKVSHFYQLDLSEEALQQILQKQNNERGENNFNVGKQGRGKSRLSNKQQEKIQTLASYYPEVDFAPLGIYV